MRCFFAAVLAFLALPVFAGSATWSGRLAAPDPTWNRVGDNCSAATTNVEWHDVQPFSVSVFGKYTVEMISMIGTSDPDAYFALYIGSFSAASPQINCSATNDDDGLGFAPGLSLSLRPGVQYLLVTTKCCGGVLAGEEVEYTNRISGPGEVQLGIFAPLVVPTLSSATLSAMLLLLVGLVSLALRRRHYSKPNLDSRRF